MKRIIAVAAAAAIASASVAFAAGHTDAITMRKNGMQGVGLAMGTLVAMAKGEAPVDAKKAAGALKSMNYVANTFGDFFPEGSADGDTTASPKIWEDMAGFEEKLEALQTDTAMAAMDAPQDQAAVQELVGMLGKGCKGCHEEYRIKK